MVDATSDEADGDAMDEEEEWESGEDGKGDERG